MADRVRHIEISLIRASRKNPRKTFDAEALDELAISIREVGVIQPIVVSPSGESFVIVAGERRWRAAKKAGLKAIPAIVRNLTKEEIAKVSFMENLHRSDLNPVEEASAMEELLRVLKASVQEIAEMLGRSTAYVYSRLRLLELPEDIQREVAQGRIAVATAGVLARLDDHSEILEVGLAAVRGQLSAYQVEATVREKLRAKQTVERSQQREDAYNSKLRRLRKESGRTVVAYNELDARKHQRVWNLRFKECKSCPLKGIFLTRDMREEDICVAPDCYSRLEREERHARLKGQLATRSRLEDELGKILEVETVQPIHLALGVFALLDLLASLSNGWRESRGLSPANELHSAGETWLWLSKATMDELVSAFVELAVIFVSASASESRLPADLLRDLCVEFGLDAEMISDLIKTPSTGFDDEAVSASAASF